VTKHTLFFSPNGWCLVLKYVSRYDEGLLSKCLCQQLKINPDPTHRENQLEKSWRLCVAYGEVYQTLLHLFTELEIASQTECRLCKTLLKQDSAPNQQMSLILK